MILRGEKSRWRGSSGVMHSLLSEELSMTAGETEWWLCGPLCELPIEPRF